MSALERCDRCRSILGPWESFRGGCACTGRQSPTNADTLYAVACSVDTALPAHDLVRLAERDFGEFVTKSTALATMAPDPRFCWAGSGTYGLYRHGILPGPRNLEQVTRLVLTATGALTIDAIAFVLRQLGYHFNAGSLKNAVSNSLPISWDARRGWTHPTGEGARLQLRREIHVVPDRDRAQFNEIIALLEKAAEQHLTTRDERLARVPVTVSQLGMEWGDG